MPWPFARRPNRNVNSLALPLYHTSEDFGLSNGIWGGLPQVHDTNNGCSIIQMHAFQMQSSQSHRARPLHIPRTGLPRISVQSDTALGQGQSGLED